MTSHPSRRQRKLASSRSIREKPPSRKWRAWAEAMSNSRGSPTAVLGKDICPTLRRRPTFRPADSS
eukprot:8345419-Pyramimonas_sp.AAC.1